MLYRAVFVQLMMTHLTDLNVQFLASGSSAFAWRTKNSLWDGLNIESLLSKITTE
jgi:hypothetical protein